MNATYTTGRPEIRPCACGNENPICWLEEQNPNEENLYGLLSPEKIECDQCGNIVWGGSEEEIADWNAQRYHDGPDSVSEDDQ